MQNQQACVWATRKEFWDSFLNDPDLARALDDARSGEPESINASTQTEASESSEEHNADTSGKHQSIGARLRAYETPITDDILRQSIR